MSILIISQGKNLDPWVEAIKARRPEIDIAIYPEVANNKVEFALTWNHPIGVFRQFPNLKCIASMGAGVDHILKDPHLPPAAAITRVVDENLTSDMADFVLALAMNHVRGMSCYKKQEEAQAWLPKPYLKVKDVTVGVMGMGVLGSQAARLLSKVGFNVRGWARTAKTIDGIKSFAGQETLGDFLAAANILICLLPLTSETANILNKTTFELLPPGAFVINVARGEHLVEEDLVEMIDSGHLSGASLDVFREEPLPQHHAFWRHPKINVTPHIASITDPASAVEQMLDNYDRLFRNEPLLHVVSPQKGY